MCESMSQNRGSVSNPWNRGGQIIMQNPLEDKFQKVKEKLQAAVQKHLVDNEDESSSEEEILESESILNSVFKNYSQLNNSHEGAERTQRFLENAFQSGAGVCLICIASVRRNDPIWGCLKCYEYFHLTCIQKWARDSVCQQKLAQDELPAFQKSNKILWGCPKCRHEYGQNEIPQKYSCFCGKIDDPQYHPWLVPHSCGDTCNKLLEPECGHSCLLLCHPGPCPPCPKTVQSYCYCQKQGPRHQRCNKKFWSCGAACGKPLACKKHFCNNSCHPGTCSPCDKQSVQPCKCGREKRKQPCFDPHWQCDKVCGKAFGCGFHSCSVVCHNGACGECPLSQKRSCPCGKTSHVLPCTEDVPTCNDTCDKLLDCGVHRCSQKCHKEKCGMCLEIVKKVCRCGQSKKDVPCQKDFLCEKKCKRLKNCKRHPCNRKCCCSVCPPCEKPCGRTLKCGHHKCSSVCHQGQCYPCPLVAEVKCRCGKTVLTVPCGRQKKTSPPKCHKPCTLPSNCHHPVRESHKCHFGDCPPCQQTCLKDRDACSHKCLERCHSAVWVKIQDDHRPAGPWEVTQPKLKRCSLPCPDCTVPVPVTCLGGHETFDRPCYKAQPSSCRQPCGRALKCGNHFCEKVCHTVTGAADDTQAGDNCQECEHPCLKKRPPGCAHRCPEPCHPGPCPPCNLNRKVKCHCGVSVLYLHCSDLAGADEQTKARLLNCGNKCPKSYPCGHKCKSDCHSGDCPDPKSCRKKVKLPCECGRSKKEFTCDVVRAANLTATDCDDKCLAKKEEAKRAKELEAEKKKEEEKRKNQRELEKFEKKFHGKKKHKEKVQKAEQPSFLDKHWIFFLSAFLGVLAGSALVMREVILGKSAQVDTV